MGIYRGIVVLHSVISNEKKIDKPHRKTKTKAHGSFKMPAHILKIGPRKLFVTKNDFKQIS
jgi:hypothetical protein